MPLLSRIRTLRWPLLGLLLLALECRPAAAQPTREYDLKAAFLYNFTSFVQWPESAFDGEEDPLVIAILGENPFRGVLEAMVRGERVGSRPIEVRQIRDVDEVGDCHVLFISPSESRRLNRVLRATRGRPILTVADLPDFAEAGGMVEFETESQYVRLAINRAETAEAGLEVSSKLLRLARLVGTPREP